MHTEDRKHDADSGNDSTNEMLQRENLIDPGNEHNHLRDEEKPGEEQGNEKRDAEAGGDGTGSVGSKPE